tara:strand:+ start:330 stop:1325 length:996 start_codon:yes stop_codon:yes gene_type:complete
LKKIKLEIENLLNKKYSLGKIKEIKQIKHNNINSNNFQILTRRKKYVVRFVTDGSNYKKIETICKILNFCKKHNVKIVEPIKNKKKSFFDREKRYYVTKYYDGKTFSGKIEEIKNLAKTTATLHTILNKTKIKYTFKPDLQNYKFLTNDEIKKIRKILNKRKLDQTDLRIKNNLNNIEKQINKIKEMGKSVDTKMLSKQLIHRDIHPNNVIFKNNFVEAIIDFNGMRKDYLISDVAFTCFRFAMFNTKDPKKIKKRLNVFLKIYLEKNNKIEKELEYLKYFFIFEMLGKLSMILRSRFFYNSNLWIIDFEKNLEYLKLVEKIGDINIKKIN